ncbi:MAG: cytochrome b [Pseudomonadota bacterium]
MSVKNTETGWGWPARLLHWSIAVLMIGMLVVGAYMVRVLGDSSEDLLLRLELTQTHKSFGFVVFVLGLIRIWWRLTNPAPPLPEGMSAMDKMLANAGHLMLYGLMIGLPVTGWLMASASPLNDSDSYIQIKNMVFGLFELPDPYDPGDEALEAILKSFHTGFAVALAALLAVHAGAALHHQYVRRDGLLDRMLRGAPKAE